MIYNTITGNTDAVEENGEAVRLYQNFWRFIKGKYEKGHKFSFSFKKNVKKCEISTRLLTVLTMRVILHAEQRKREKEIFQFQQRC